jgi:hypothetical protein
MHTILIPLSSMRCRNRNIEYLQYNLRISALVWILAATLSEAEDMEENREFMEAGGTYSMKIVPVFRALCSMCSDTRLGNPAE